MSNMNPTKLADLLGNRTRTVRLYNKAFARMTRYDGYQPFGYDMVTMRLVRPAWADTLQCIAKAHNSLPVIP